MAYIATTIRPGFLVGLKTSITGNVKYTKEVIEANSYDETTGQTRAKWETERTVKNAKEQEAASKVRNRVRSLIASPCSLSSFGLLCPDAAKPDLDAAVDEARKLAAEFNASATTTRLHVAILTGKIAPDDVVAIKAINGEVTQLIDDMKAGLDKLDVKAVRDAANRAKQLGQMLNADAQARIQIAIDAVRKTARKIADAGETASIEIDRRTIAALAETRTAFLDLDEAREMGTPTAEGRAIDLAPSDVKAAPAAPERFIEVQ